MTLKIEKTRPGYVRVEFTHDTAKKPIVIELQDYQVEVLIGILGTAKKADHFMFLMSL